MRHWFPFLTGTSAITSWIPRRCNLETWHPTHVTHSTPFKGSSTGYACAMQPGVVQSHCALVSQNIHVCTVTGPRVVHVLMERYVTIIRTKNSELEVSLSLRLDHTLSFIETFPYYERCVTELGLLSKVYSAYPFLSFLVLQATCVHISRSCYCLYGHFPSWL